MTEDDRGEPGQADEEHRLVAERRAKLAALRARRNAFPNDFRRDAEAGDLQQRFKDQDKAELEALDHVVRVAGRLMRKRGPFLVLQDQSGQIQLYINRSDLDEATLEEIKSWDIGDIVGAQGPVHRSGKGDLYVNMHQARLLTKSLRPLPDKYHGLADTEIRYRQRYVDLIMNEGSRRVFRTRSVVIDALRDFLNDNGFLEVETPMMQRIRAVRRPDRLRPITTRSICRCFCEWRRNCFSNDFLSVVSKRSSRSIVIFATRGSRPATIPNSRCSSFIRPTPIIRI